MQAPREHPALKDPAPSAARQEQPPEESVYTVSGGLGLSPPLSGLTQGRAPRLGRCRRVSSEPRGFLVWKPGTSIPTWGNCCEHEHACGPRALARVEL